MRRGRMALVVAVCAVAVTCGVVANARADSGGPGSPLAICHDLQDGKLNGTYTQAQWNAFLADPTVQGYCSVIVPPCVYPPAPPGGQPGGPACQTRAASRSSAVPLTPVAQSTPHGVQGAHHTLTAPPVSATRSARTLPFTGANLAFFALAALGLVGAGLALLVGGRRRRGVR